MISFDFNDTYTTDGVITVTFDGHAYSDIPGKDLICAMASVLLLQAVTLCDEMYKRGYLDDKPMYDIRSGHAAIKIHPIYSMYGIVKKMLEVVEMGCVAICDNDKEHTKMLKRIGDAKFPTEPFAENEQI